MKSKLKFVSRGVSLIGDLYFPDAEACASGDALPCVPAVVSSAGFGGVKEMLLPDYAEALADAGIACLLFDYAGFGESDGVRRQHVDPVAQAAAFGHALDALCAHPRIDSERLGVWGPSLAGGHTLTLASTDPRVKCAVAIIPYISAPPIPEPRIAAEVLYEGLRAALGLPDRMIPAAGEPGTRAVMVDDGAAAWIRGISRGAPTFRNEVTVRSLWNMGQYNTARAAASIEVPLRVILASEDSITPAQKVRAALSRQPTAQRDIVEFPETHFELFGRHNPEVIRLTVAWFVQHLDARLAHTPSAAASRAAPPA